MPTRTLKSPPRDAARTFGADLLRFPYDRQAAAHRSLGVVFARLTGAKHREQAVSGVLQYAALVIVHDGGESLQWHRR
jgi:hypothetical protein